MLQDILKNKNCFKLVCGAGNEDAKEVEKLVALYAKAGANYFDLSAREDVVKAAYKGLERVISTDKLKEYYFNVSVGIKGDPHVSKAYIDNIGCISCGACKKICLQKAIKSDQNIYKIDQKRCIGCGFCIKNCPQNTIISKSENKPLDQVLPSIIDLGIDSIELHIVSNDTEKIYQQWNVINNIFDGVLSICTDRTHIGDIELINRLKFMIKDRKEFSTIIQADGAPMSGCNDENSTTLQAIATAQIVDRAKLPVYLMLSGGTNSKTTQFAKSFDINAHGVAIGSYGRMIVREYIDRDDFLENKEVFNKAFEIAKNLVDKSMKYMGDDK